MKTPDKIYLQVCGDCPQTDCDDCKFEDLVDNVTWCQDRIFEKDKVYISKDVLLAWAKKKGKDSKSPMLNLVYNNLIEKIESL